MCTNKGSVNILKEVHEKGKITATIRRIPEQILWKLPLVKGKLVTARFPGDLLRFCQ